jgi:flagellin-like protein
MIKKRVENDRKLIQINFFIKNKKGISPVIATVLLIGIVIMLGVIIFLWLKNMQQETITKFGDTNIVIVCEEIEFKASYSEKTLFISNVGGKVPIYDLNIKMLSDGGHKTNNLREMSENWPKQGLNQGATFLGKINLDESVTKINLIPILLGSSTKGEKKFICDERQGIEIDIQ